MRVRVLALMVALVSTCSSLALAAPFSDFLAMGPEARAKLQIKLSEIDRETATAPSLGLCVASRGLDLSRFRMAQQSGITTERADAQMVVCSITLEQLGAVLVSAGEMPEMTHAALDSAGRFSFAILDTARDSLGYFETTLDDASSLALIRRLHAALSGSPRASSLLAAMACAMEPVADPARSEVTSFVRATFSAFANDPVTRRTSCTLRIVNESRGPMSGPLVAVIEAAPASVRMVAPDGHTCAVYRTGTPYVALPVEHALAPGAWVERRIVFENPRQENVRFSRRIFVGMLER